LHIHIREILISFEYQLSIVMLGYGQGIASEKIMILDGWTDDNTSRFQKDVFKVKHKLSETGLFTDDALAALLDKHPRDKLDVCTYGEHDVFDGKFRTGDASQVDGKILIEAARSGTIWMNLRKAMNLHPEYNAVLKEMYGEIADIVGRKPYNARGGILISSPTAKVPYHFDATETILWHVRGHKKMYLFPRTKEFLPDEGYEYVMFSNTEDYLPYDTSMESFATIIDLKDGEMATWPLNAPHRVENKTYCVSVTTEYSTRESTIKNSVMYANAVLRQKYGQHPDWRSASKTEIALKAGIGKMMRKAGVLKSMKTADFVSFEVDKSAPGFVRDIEPYQRRF